MKFFIPNVTESNSAEEVYQGIRKFVAKQMGDTPTARRIFSIDFLHNMKEYHAEVGKLDRDSGEIVIAIIESAKLYYVCTPNRGVLRGMPLLTGKNEVRLVTEFDQ